jgi:X-Pro dipeptidyl-peptidase C-terminal non-catalytic domain
VYDRIVLRRADARREPVQPTITLYPASNLFMSGYRIRLDVSSSNFPRFDVNPNTGEGIGRERRRVVADNTVSHEPGREFAGDGAGYSGQIGGCCCLSAVNLLIASQRVLESKNRCQIGAQLG